MIRRICFIAMSIFVDYATFQTISILYMNLAVVIFVGRVKPFERVLRNKIEFINESLI